MDFLKALTADPILQIEIHPSLPQEEMLKWANEHNIALTAYSPLGNPGFSWFASTGHSKTLEEPAVGIINKGLFSKF